MIRIVQGERRTQDFSRQAAKVSTQGAKALRLCDPFASLRETVKKGRHIEDRATSIKNLTCCPCSLWHEFLAFMMKEVYVTIET
jgi:hypothetical protein